MKISLMVFNKLLKSYKSLNNKTYKMKTKLLLITLISCYSFAQENTIKLKDLELPNAPAFTILDYTPTVISAPTTPQSLTLSLINATSTSSGIPTNYALEFNPYLLFLGKNNKISDYFKNEDKFDNFNPIKNLSFSLASVKNENIQNLSFGVRTNLYSINRKEKKEVLKNLKNIVNKTKNTFLTKKSKLTNTESLDLENEKKIIYEELDTIINSKPVFSVDVAAAYNHFFDKNEYRSGKTGRYGAWLTFYGNFIFKKIKNSFLSFYQYSRYLVNNMTFDPALNQYLNTKDLDIGAKIEFQYDRFSMGYEYINRTNQKENFRSVGNLKYKINSKITLNGGFGRNFEKTDNLVSFLGINWGIAAESELKMDYDQPVADSNAKKEIKKTASVKVETKKNNDVSAYESTNLNLNIIAVSAKTTNIDLLLDDSKASFTIDFQKQGNDNAGSYNISQKENLDNYNQIIFAGKSGFIRKFQEDDEFDEKAFLETSKVFLQGNSTTDYITTVPNSLTFNDSNYIAFKVENKETKKIIYGWLKLSITKDKVTIIKMGYLDRLPLSIGN